ncbi:hypothetical protein CTA2_9881 [Colletotrichum tanaceti]|uniref:Uncharacterized protein n=1 Tax=Colletotrichum tanaceti TaxID=1306861 RepID=A0A4U6X1E6_9PEZI|nr:hypothetical protein CTA2_9881 [Colletotrichum tanaceti]TKW48965.1 hypothetical protein CTA1_5110 [Colletotrichum tanaceti]
MELYNEYKYLRLPTSVIIIIIIIIHLHSFSFKTFTSLPGPQRFLHSHSFDATASNSVKMLARSVLLLALGAVASAQEYVGFPNSVTCKTGRGTVPTGSADFTRIQLQDTMVGPKGTMQDKSAANAASGKCTSLSGIPYYTVDPPGADGAWFSYAFDESKNTYYFCRAFGTIENGFSSQCTEK